MKTIQTADERNYGIDLLRIVSMLSIVVLHVLGEGGIGAGVAPYGKSYYSYWAVRFCNEFAVDAYGMISGYVMCTSRPRLSRLLQLWLEVMFYSVGISMLFILFNRSSVPDVHAELYSMLLPITGARYWYMSGYFCLFLLIPVLNAGIEQLSGVQMRSTLVGLFVLICMLGSWNISRKDPFGMNYGFSAAWLCILYLAGGACRKYRIHERLRVWQALLGIAVCVGLTVAFKSWMDHNRWRLPYTLDWMLMSNVSVTYSLTAFFMLNLFARIRLGARARRIVAVLAPATLGVYLIHVHPLIWKQWLSGRFAPLAQAHWLVMLAGAAASALGIFLACLAVDLGRIALFRLLRVDRACRCVERIITGERQPDKP